MVVYHCDMYGDIIKEYSLNQSLILLNKCKCHHHYFQTKDSSSLAFVRRKESPHFTPCYSQGAV